MANKVKYRHPILSVDNLVTTFNESFGLGISKSELSNPNADRIINIYYAFLNDLGNLDGAQQAIAKFLYDENFRIEELDQAIVYTNVYSILESLEGLCPDLTFGDIINPTPKRVQMILSNLVNFWLYYCSRQKETIAVLEKCKNIVETKNRLEVQAPNYEKQINDTISDIYNKRQQCEQKNKSFEELTNRCKGHLEKKPQVQVEKKLLKTEQEGTEQEYKQTQTKVEELELRVADCESKILESPVKLNEMLDEMSVEFNKIKADFNETMKKSENIKKSISNCSTWITEITVIKSLMKSIADQRNDVIHGEDEKKMIEAEQQTTLENISDADANLKLLSHKENSIKEQIHSLEVKQHTETASLQVLLDNAKKSLEKIESDNLDRNKDSVEYMDEIVSLAKKIATLRLSWQAKEEESEHHIANLKQTLDVYYCDRMDFKFKSLNESIVTLSM